MWRWFFSSNQSLFVINVCDYIITSHCHIYKANIKSQAARQISQLFPLKHALLFFSLIAHVQILKKPDEMCTSSWCWLLTCHYWDIIWYNKRITTFINRLNKRTWFKTLVSLLFPPVSLALVLNITITSLIARARSSREKPGRIDFDRSCQVCWKLVRATQCERASISFDELNVVR